jgi:biopolymer transport protein ExbD
MLKLRYWLLVVFCIFTSEATSAAENTQRITITLSDSKATILLDERVLLRCMTAALDAATELGYDEVIVSEVGADRHTLSPTGVSFAAIVDDDTVTFRSSRPVPTKVVICFLKHLRTASIEKVRFASIDSNIVKESGGPADARESSN